MAEERFPDKVTPLVRTSIARRILWVCFSLLALPLLVIAFLSYQKEEKFKLEELLLLMDTLGTSQVKLIEEMVTLRFENLEMSELFLQRSLLGGPPTTAKTWQEFAYLFLVQELFAAEWKDGAWRYVASTESAQIGQVCPLIPHGFEIPASDTAALPRTEWILVDPAKATAAEVSTQPSSASLVVLRAFPVAAAQQGTPAYRIWGLTVPAPQMVHRLLAVERSIYPYDISLWDNQGRLFGADYSVDFQHHYVPYTEAEVRERGWTNFTEGGRQVLSTIGGVRNEPHVGLRFPIEGTPLFLILDISERFVTENALRQLFLSSLEVVVVILVIGGAASYLLARRMARPISALANVMQAIRNERYEVRYQPDTMGFEFNMLGETFNETIDTLLRHMAAAEQQKLVSERLALELGIGRSIQQSLCPRREIDLPHIETAHSLVPAKEVSGDFFDLFEQRGEVLIVMADTVGKGISACLYALTFRSVLRSFFVQGGSFTEMLEKTHALFSLDASGSGVFVTVWVGMLSQRPNGELLLRFAACGHPPALLYRRGSEGGRGQILDLGSNALPVLGAFPISSFTCEEIVLQTGDHLLLYTDGITEAADANELFFGTERLREEVLLHGAESPAELVEHILQSVHNFTGECELSDDQTLLALRVTD